MMVEGTIKAGDGRKIAYAVYGDRRGIPVFHLHGTPGSRLEAGLIAAYLKRDDVCFIGIDRPGYGCSEMRPRWKVTDIPDDVDAVADELGYDRFILMGYSGGGPCALACAWKIPQRLKAVGIISGLGPAKVGSQGMHESNRGKYDLAQRFPWLVRWMIRLAFAPVKRDPVRLEAMLEKTWKQMPAPDQQALQDRTFRSWIIRETMDAISHGTDGFAHEEAILPSPWGFALADIRHVPIFIWHGGQDRNIPVAMGNAMAAEIQGCKAAIAEDEGHLSLIYHRGTEIVETLVRASTVSYGLSVDC